MLRSSKVKSLFFVFAALIFATQITQAENNNELQSNSQFNEPITITTYSIANLGYIAYVNTLVRILAPAFPDRKIQIIIELSNVFRNSPEKIDRAKESINRYFPFPDDVDVMYKVRGGDKHLDSIVEKWLKKSSSVLVAVAPIEAIKAIEAMSSWYKKYNCIHIGQISDGWFRHSPPYWSTSYLNMGLSEKDDGILLAPNLLSAAQSQNEAHFYDDFLMTLTNYPRLASVLEEYSLEEKSLPHYYMAYMHNSEAFVEYIALISYLENGRTPVLLSNITDYILNSPSFRTALSRHGVDHISLINSDGHRDREIELNPGRDTTVVLYRIPIGMDTSSYLSLIRFSQPTIGVTGNQSLFQAIALNKLPIYDVNHPYQSEVNSNLQKFDFSGKLLTVFNNTRSPKLKADAIKQYSDQILPWSQRILSQKVINQQLIELIKSIQADEDDFRPYTLLTPTDHSLFLYYYLFPTLIQSWLKPAHY